MSAPMRVGKLTLVGSGESWEWSFTGPVNVLSGPIGVGKTSLLELIKFGLGGEGLLSRTIRDVGSRVAIHLSLPNGNFVLVRTIGSGSRRVSVVTAEGEPVRTLPTHGGPQEDSISTWLLDQLGIPSTLRMPRSRTRPKHEFTRVSFFDIFTYMYLEQSEADRSTAHDLDPVRDPKRRQTFEVIYRLLGQDIADLRVRAAELQKIILDRGSSEQQIVEFLQRLNIGNTAQLNDEERKLTGQLLVAQRQLAATREEARGRTAGLEQPRDALQALRERITEAKAQRNNIAQEAEALERLRARIQLDHRRTARALTAGGALASAAWEICPRCLQDLPEPATSNVCVVCGQPDPEGLRPDDLQAEQQRLAQQVHETSGLLAQIQQRARDLDDELATLSHSLSQREAMVDEQARADVAPFMDKIARVSEVIGGHQARLAEIARWQAMRVDLQRSADVRKAEKKELEHVLADLAAAEDEADMARGRIDDLSALFEDILLGFKHPWIKQASIDRKTFRPLVNGMHLPELLSGGMKVMVNDAYYLANLTYSLQSPADSLLPTFMMIDTPRKNFGSGPEDREASLRIYRWIHTLRTQYGHQFQMIIADNDVPTAVRSGLRIKAFSYEKPLIPDVEHPGEGNVETLDQLQAAGG